MKTKNLFTSIFFLTCVLSCDDNNGSDSSLVNRNPITINIQPFDGCEQEHVKFVFKELSKSYSKILINKPIALPENAYYKPRNRYKADSLIKFLQKITPQGHVTIGLTNKDICTRKGWIEDYGIMGLAYQPGSSCIVSTFRLSKKNLQEQYYKVSIHELGHTQGLPHCIVKTCFMRDAEGKNRLDEEIDFCPSCKTHMSLKGWTFKI